MENRIGECRLRLKLSQLKLGVLVGLSSQVISDFERGARQPWPKARRALAQALGVSEAELFPAEKGGAIWRIGRIAKG